MPWTRSGTVSVAQNSTTVTGTGTDFAANTRVGDAFVGPDGRQYEITNAASATVISILPAYAGPTLAAGNYAIVPIQGYNKDTADALRQASLEVGDALDGLEASVQAAADSAAAALISKNAAGTSEANASQSAGAALSSKNAASTSETNAGQSAAAALASKSAAGTSETNAGQSAAAALASKNAAAISEANAAASAGTAGNVGVGKGFIEGLQMLWVSLNSIQILPGSCFMPNLNRVYKVPATLTVTPPAGVTGFGHIYLYDNAGTPAVEMVTTEPVQYWNDARNKTGDPTRRYIGSALLNNGNAYNFRHYPAQGKVNYLYATPTTAPFNPLSGGTALVATVVSAAAVCPSTATHMDALVSCAGSGAIYVGNEEQAIQLSNTNWQIISLSTGYTICTIAFSLANTLRRFQYIVSGSGISGFVSTLGYIFGR
ncbi:hypothetical protein [Pseudomonas sp. S2_H01]